MHEDRKRALGAEKSKEMTEAALKRARSDNLALQSEINQKDATILACKKTTGISGHRMRLSTER